MKPTDPSALLDSFTKALDALPAEAVTVDFARKFLKAQGARMGLEWWEVLKTPAFYARVMKEQIRLFYTAQTDVFGFLDRMFSLIDDQFKRAFNEGLRSVGFDPKNITQEMGIELNLRIQQELGHMLDFAQELEQARNAGLPVEPFYMRIPLWAIRYSEIVDFGALMGGTRNDLYMWRLGRTEKHCATCATLAGTVATKSEWLASGLKPQNAPNPRLECRGWRCDCALVPVSNVEPTPGGIPNV